MTIGRILAIGRMLDTIDDVLAAHAISLGDHIERQLAERIADLIDEQDAMPAQIGAAGVEYMIVVDYGGRDGIHGREHRTLGKATIDHARAAAAELLRDVAQQVALYQRDVSEWKRLRTGTHR